MQIGWLTDDLNVKGPMPMRTPADHELDPRTVRFIAAAPDRQLVEDVLSAASSVLQQPVPDYNAPPNPAGKYVYGYFENPNQPCIDQAFYIGKGTRRRWTTHVRNRIDAGAQNARTDKERRIDAWIREQRGGGNDGPANLVSLAENTLCRLLGRWEGPNADACAFAAEYALISGVRGAYQLANETGGNGCAGELRVLVREAGLNLDRGADLQVWHEAVCKFFRDPDAPILRSRIRPSLILLANLRILTWLDNALQEIGLVPSPRGPNQGNPLPCIPAHFGIEGASDVSITYIPSDERPFRIQVKLSHEHAGAVINVRPRQDAAEARRAFFAFMDRVRPNGFGLVDRYGGTIPIRDANRNPYFKPFATNGNGRAETWFPVREGEDPVPTSPNWAAAEQLLLTLPEALRLFLEAFSDPV